VREVSSATQVICVGMGEGIIASRADAVLVAPGLGSCVAVVVHARRPLVGGMAHIMLPRAFGQGHAPFKFADTAIPALLAALEEGGVSPAAIRICLVGGARMFEMGPGSPLNLGERNVEAIREVLRQRGLRVHAEDVGGCVSRTVTLHVGSGRITVRSGAGEERELSRDVGPR
jgi:chemotaxis protein CheD